MAKKSKTKGFWLVRIGSDNRPATTEDIKDMEDKVKTVLGEDENVLVTHHAVEIDFFKTSN